MVNLKHINSSSSSSSSSLSSSPSATTTNSTSIAMSNKSGSHGQPPINQVQPNRNAQQHPSNGSSQVAQAARPSTSQQQQQPRGTSTYSQQPRPIQPNYHSHQKTDANASAGPECSFDPHIFESIEYPFCTDHSKYEQVAKIGQGTFG
jgi:hypothetical protein